MMRKYSFLHHSIYINKTAAIGRGVFTRDILPANMVIEIAPAIVMSGEERKLLDQTLLHDYIFEWGDDRRQCAMALGYIPIYNHAYQSNCEYEMDFKKEIITVKTVRAIAAGEELFINYNGDWDNESEVWFETSP